MDELIFVSLENWDDIWRRNQFLCAELLGRNPGIRILFIEPPRDISNAVRKRQWGLLCPTEAAPTEFADRLRRFRPLKLLPNSVTLGRRFNEWLARRQIADQLKKMNFERPLLWINAHQAVHLVGRLGESAVIYDITDDWTEAKQSAGTVALTQRQDAALCRAAHAVIVCSERLAELKKPMCSELHLIPNGVDPEHYRRVLESREPLVPECLGWPKPVFGYTGTIHPDRLDLKLLETVARKIPSGSLVLIGPNHLGAHDRERLLACGNVYLAGPKPYAEIPELMRGFDACIVPHLVTPFTESLNPIKLWEYLAAGKPIVSTPVAGFRGFPELVHLASGAEEFCQALEGALRENPDLPERRRQEARRHSWKKRVDAIEKVLLELDEPRRRVAL